MSDAVEFRHGTSGTATPSRYPSRRFPLPEIHAAQLLADDRFLSTERVVEGVGDSSADRGLQQPVAVVAEGGRVALDRL
ncbi:hypothetical protein ACH4SP_35245 [Streptomyces sp. NPDC021093]|uniref:hypothetical protein n=1 Tax=Streptomyces sp. NPDC021093 TaxID=3365112 RepID=UPI0037AED20A